VRTELFRTDRRTDMAKLMVAFRNAAKLPKILPLCPYICLSTEVHFKASYSAIPQYWFSSPRQAQGSWKIILRSLCVNLWTIRCKYEDKSFANVLYSGTQILSPHIATYMHNKKQTHCYAFGPYGLNIWTSTGCNIHKSRGKKNVGR
jgi:hypothetical protein